MQKLKKGCVRGFLAAEGDRSFCMSRLKRIFTSMAHRPNKMTILDLQSLTGLGTL
jgi:hypothetical protein